MQPRARTVFGSVTSESVALLESEHGSQFMEQLGPHRFVLNVDTPLQGRWLWHVLAQRDRFQIWTVGRQRWGEKASSMKFAACSRDSNISNRRALNSQLQALSLALNYEGSTPHAPILYINHRKLLKTLHTTKT